MNRGSVSSRSDTMTYFRWRNDSTILLTHQLQKWGAVLRIYFRLFRKSKLAKFRKLHAYEKYPFYSITFLSEKTVTGSSKQKIY